MRVARTSSSSTQLGAHLRVRPQQVDAVSASVVVLGPRPDRAAGASSMRSSRRSRSGSSLDVGRLVGAQPRAATCRAARRRRRGAAVRRLGAAPPRAGPAARDGEPGGLAQVRPASGCRRRRRRARARTRRGTRPARSRAARCAATAAPRPSPPTAVGIASRRLRSTISLATAVELHVAAGGRNGNRRCTCSLDRCPACRRAAPGSGGRAELLAVVPTKSSTVQTVLPCALRSPRPSCCRNSVGLSVGRSISSVSTAGTSTPSLNRSTENTTLHAPAARSRSAASPLVRGLSPQTATAAMPCVVEDARHEAGVRRR